MSDDPASSLLGAFHYLREVYSNVARMLLACDPLLKPHGYLPYGPGWKPMALDPVALEGPEWWMASQAVRQYYPKGQKDRAILTVGAVLWNPEDEKFACPLAIASLMHFQKETNACYWMPLLQAWHLEGKADGKVQVLENDSPGLQAFYKEGLTDPKIATVAVPLLEITNASTLETRLLRPLVDHVRKQQ